MRREFSAKTKLAAWQRCAGFCEGCTAKLFPGNTEYDHINPDGLTGTNDVENCAVLCRTCHRSKTRLDIGRIAKAKRQERRHAGIRKPRTIRAWRKFNRQPVYAPRER